MKQLILSIYYPFNKITLENKFFILQFSKEKLAWLSPASKQTQLIPSNFIPSILILAFLLVGFIPNLEAVDKIAPQWLYLSFLNLICGFFFSSKEKYLIDRYFKNFIIKNGHMLYSFCLWACLFIFLCYKLQRRYWSILYVISIPYLCSYI